MKLSNFTPARLKAVGDMTLNELVLREIPRARKRVAEMEERFPSAERREIAQRLIEEKQGLGQLVGGVTGLFGILTIPADLAVMLWLELTLQVEVATVYKSNLKGDSERAALLDLFGDTSGLGPLVRAGPRAVGSLTVAALVRAGLKPISKAVPMVASFTSAALNKRHLQKVGEAAIRHHEGFGKAKKKTAEASG